MLENLGHFYLVSKLFGLGFVSVGQKSLRGFQAAGEFCCCVIVMIKSTWRHCCSCSSGSAFGFTSQPLCFLWVCYSGVCCHFVLLFSDLGSTSPELLVVGEGGLNLDQVPAEGAEDVERTRARQELVAPWRPASHFDMSK